MNEETSLKRRVLSALKTQHPGSVVFKIADKFTAGIPDLIIVINGRVIWIELKTPKGKVSNIQQYTIDKINSAGGRAYICRSVDEVMNVMEKEVSENGSRERIAAELCGCQG